MSGGMITSAVAGVASQLAGALDGLFTSDDERNKAKLKMQELLMQPQMMQALANLRSAEHASIFVAGARPAALWVCVAGFFWEFFLRPIVGALLVIASLWGGNPELLVLTADELPHINAEVLTSLLYGLLGLSAIRGIEKVKGVSRNRIK